jgi:two-component system chemotaxis response regulator CheB
MIRVLVVDDSATARQMLIDTINADPSMEVVGIAADGAEAVLRARELRPDIVTMDINMPVHNGYEATRQIMRDAPSPILIVSAAASAEDSAASMIALRAGALGIAAKPSGFSDAASVEERRHLLVQIRALSDVKVVGRATPAEYSALPVRTYRAPRSTEGASIVGIAASTGGPAALAAIVAGLPVDLSVPLVVVQHNTHGFMPALAKWLNECGNVRVVLATHGGDLRPGVMYIGPDHRHIGVTAGGVCMLSDGPPIAGFRPSATFLFRSLGEAYGPRALSVILTGMGSDGVEGLAAAHAAGGIVVAQDEKSSVVWGMPGAAVNAGVVDHVVELDGIAAAIAKAVTVSRR